MSDLCANKEQRRTTQAVVILLSAKNYFAGFGSDIALKKAIVRSTTVLGAAQLLSASNPSKVADYLSRLSDKGYHPEALTLALAGPYDPRAVIDAQNQERHRANP